MECNIWDEIERKKIKYVIMDETKDNITIIVFPDNKNEFINELKLNNYKKFPHSQGREKGYQFLYAMTPVELWKNEELNFSFTVFEDFACPGLFPKSWLPLHKKIAASLWVQRKKDIQKGYYIPHEEERLIYTITNVMLGKRKFEIDDITKIENLKFCLDNESFIKKMELIFFNFTPTLIQSIKAKQYNNLFLDYIKFCLY